MPGRGGRLGRTGCEGSGRGPPMGAWRGGSGPPGRCGARAAAPVPGRGAAGRLRLPVGACDPAGDGAAGRTRTGRRGGAGGAWPVRGSSTRKRSVGGTTRPGAGVTGLGAGCAAGSLTATAAGGACSAGGSAASRGSSTDAGSDSATGSGAALGDTASMAGSACSNSGAASATGAADSAGSAAGASTTSSGGGAANLALLIRRGGGSDGAAGRAGSGGFPGFLPLDAAGESANDAFDGTLMLR